MSHRTLNQDTITKPLSGARSMSRKTPFFWTHLIFIIFLFTCIAFVLDACTVITHQPHWAAWIYMALFGAASGWFGWFSNPFEED